MIKIFLFTTFNFLCLYACSPKPEPETYLIREGYKGRVNIIFNQRDGVPPKYEKARRIYEVPGNGILLTQFKDEYGLVDHRYFYVDSNGKRTSLEILTENMFESNDSKVNQNSIGIFLDGTTGQYGSSNDAVWLQGFIVCSYNELHHFFSTKYKKQFEDSLTKAIGIIVVVP